MAGFQENWVRFAEFSVVDIQVAGLWDFSISWIIQKGDYNVGAGRQGRVCRYVVAWKVGTPTSRGVTQSGNKILRASAPRAQITAPASFTTLGRNRQNS